LEFSGIFNVGSAEQNQPVSGRNLVTATLVKHLSRFLKRAVYFSNPPSNDAWWRPRRNTPKVTLRPENTSASLGSSSIPETQDAQELFLRRPQGCVQPYPASMERRQPLHSPRRRDHRPAAVVDLLPCCLP